ncbi:Lipin/Ned1/Smp2-domain-containing protein [Protomyces lactucae-debilis]|uniref:Lipin/Ned1/Smp2-domain-containing protein n=1 Tax=Protomyces lactucae-debilis TaxID=2754530 RepID=A0A1Y2EZP7_PROLT|nr:Lipin/Ned1/Smp2-domain-containing protein [Protomyces lactucae-debilis]ORY77053.1 Lipin/Ned1/Smp2-domain-containing protein [Protomyces lactucae-debilis]
MNLVGRAIGSVSKTWNSINPATLSGAIDVIVVEQQDGDLACSPFHVRFGKFQLLRPSEKKVEFRINEEKVEYGMKLGDGGEAFFVFQTDSDVPEDLQTSPLVSPVASPTGRSSSPLPEPEFFELNEQQQQHIRASSAGASDAPLELGNLNERHLERPITPTSEPDRRPRSGDWGAFDLSARPDSPAISEPIGKSRRHTVNASDPNAGLEMLKTYPAGTLADIKLRSDLSMSTQNAIQKAEELLKKLALEDIPTHVTDAGDIMLDMHGYKSHDDDFTQMGSISDHIIAGEELTSEGKSLVSADERGNLWIYATEETKQYAQSIRSNSPVPEDQEGPKMPTLHKVTSDPSPFANQNEKSDSPNYAKTLRLTSDQLRGLKLKDGENSMSFKVGKSVCTASLFFWKFDTPIVISDIDGTITKSDALGHLLNMVGRDWTHPGVAKLYTDIANNGYHWLYLSSRSVGQADTTRNYLRSIVQDKYKLPHGPVILSPDRLMAALRREVILRKPEVFKMQCLRDLQNLFGKENKPFHAGFGNRITDAISYRYVDVRSSRIFTINSYGDVQMELLQFAGYKVSYISMNDLVDHFFPPVKSTSVKEESDYTDFTFWRPPVPAFAFSDDEDEEDNAKDDAEDGGSSDQDYHPSEMGEDDQDGGSSGEETSAEDLREEVAQLRSDAQQHESQQPQQQQV